MPNVANVLKTEISRIARKEVKSETEQLKKASALYRHQLAALRKKVEALEGQLRRSNKGDGADPSLHENGESDKRLRFSAAKFAAQRQKLGLSQADMAKLIGVSSLSVHKWEKGQTRPRRRQLEAISHVRGIGKREAAARLGSMGN